MVLGDTQVIGRLPSNAIPIQDVGSSRQNTRIYKSAGGFSVIDLNSKNGTYVNEERVERAELKDGDVVRIGTTAFRFSADPEAAPEPATTRRSPAAALAGNPDEVIQFGAGGTTISTATVSERALQFSKTGSKQRRKTGTFGFLRADLSQQPFLFRMLMLVGVLLIMVGIAAWLYHLIAGGGTTPP